MDFKEALSHTDEYGIVEELRYPLITARGLPGATINEVVVFSNDQEGQVIGLNHDVAEILLLSPTPPRPGTRVTRTAQELTVPVGAELLGGVVNAIGQPLLDGTKRQRPSK